MKIYLEDIKVVGYSTFGNVIGGIEIDENILPENFFSEWASGKFLYVDGVVSEDPDFVPPPEPEPEPTLQEQVAALAKQNQMLTDCILEMSEIVYGGD